MISVVINTLNEEKNIRRAILSVKNFADEILVCDMNSLDNTAKIAKELGARVIHHENVGYVEPARNWAISEASGDWVLVLDADEEIPNSLIKKLKEIVGKPEADYFRIPRKNIIFGKWIKHSRWWPDYNIRFFKKGYVSWNEIIHSIPVTQGKGGDLADKEKYAILHHNYSSLDAYFERLGRYTTIQAGELLKNGYIFSWKDIITKPLNEFLSRFFVGEGYKDELHGLALCLLQSFSELVLYLKVWEKQGFKEKTIEKKELRYELNKAIKDLRWWINKKLSWLRFL